MTDLAREIEELLAKVEARIEGTAHLTVAKWPDAVYVTRYDYDEDRNETEDTYEGPTLAEALRKLVESDS